MASNESGNSWGSRSAFILATIGSAVGLGNAWRFPGLVAKNGGGSFLLIYIIGMIIIGTPLIIMEVSIGRKTKRGAALSLRSINKKAEFVGWASTGNAFCILIYYTVVFAWVLMMMFYSFRFIDITGTSTPLKDASMLWANLTQTSGNLTGAFNFSIPVIIALVAVWALIYYCIRNGTNSVGKVIKLTVFVPVAILLIMSVKGLTTPGAIEGLKVLFIPDWSAFSHASLWVDAIGQVFYSSSIMMCILFAYGSYLEKSNNLVVDCTIVSLSSIIVSVLSGIVIFTTMYGIGMTTADMSSSGIATAFQIYPTAIVQFTNNGIVNALFGAIFYLCLVTLALDSAFSIVEGVAKSIADKFNLNMKKCVIGVCVVAGILSLFLTSSAGVAIIDIIDNWTNNYNMMLVGIAECIAIGWCLKTSKLIEEININTKKIKMPTKYFALLIKFIVPVFLLFLFVWNIISLVNSGGVYGASSGYDLTSNVVFGWITTAFVFILGFIIKIIYNKKVKKNPELAKTSDIEWDKL